MTGSLSFWAGKRVFLTGHTGFKGAWLTVWLHTLGAKLAGYALPPEDDNALYDSLKLSACFEQNTLADLAELSTLKASVANFAPDIVIHMAAQSLVRRSYREPLSTIAANVTGTAHLLEACRGVDSIKAALVVTTDKCYQNLETGQAYKETDALGGRDIYSASKAAAEIITHAYRQSLFDSEKIRICTARAGNVIGAGDMAEDRLLPDAVRAFTQGEELLIRSPKALRPWQHVVEPLSGYMMLAQAMFENKKPLSPAYNFGPEPSSVVPVEEVISRFAALWQPAGKWRVEVGQKQPHEAALLALDSALAREELGWKPHFTLEEALAHTAAGYRQLQAHDSDTLRAHMRGCMSHANEVLF
ncbi:MAG: CDP-glucose 4,6-dehydratase [Alphaproteobacteria bacterium]|nr:CDP-glucose 4,6-dehydratase [Alphaproteobacteria bacterium]